MLKYIEFKDLCSKKEYKNAYDLYYKDKGAFLVALKSTTAQYVFYTEVLSELDRKYDPTHALENMVSNLNLAYYKRKEAIAAQASASAKA